jgi:hypothetical protein
LCSGLNGYDIFNHTHQRWDAAAVATRVVDYLDTKAEVEFDLPFPLKELYEGSVDRVRNAIGSGHEAAGLFVKTRK